MWDILEDEHIVKRLFKLRSNKEVVDGYRRAVSELARSSDPGKISYHKHGTRRYTYVYRITRSYRLLYRVDPGENTITMVDLDDHKDIYGRD